MKKYIKLGTIFFISIVLTLLYNYCLIGKKVQEQIRLDQHSGYNSINFIGNLGHRLGTILHLKGNWIASSNYTELKINYINGNKAHGDLKFNLTQIRPAPIGFKKAPKNTGLDWIGDFDSREYSPRANLHSSIELIGFEVGEFKWFDNEVWMEVRKRSPANLWHKDGFTTYFEYVGIKFETK